MMHTSSIFRVRILPFPYTDWVGANPNHLIKLQLCNVKTNFHFLSSQTDFYKLVPPIAYTIQYSYIPVHAANS